MVTFGLLTDTHVAHRPTWRNRYYGTALQKIRTCMEIFKERSVDFIVHIGDVIDEPGDTQAGITVANEVLSVLKQFDIATYFVLGNHDINSIPKDLFGQMFNIPSSACYHAFSMEEYRFIFLDCLHRQDGEHYTPGTVNWEELYIPLEQQAWLKQELEQASGQNVVLFVHGLLDDMSDPHVICNAKDIREILGGYPKIRAVFQGHMHGGHFSVVCGIPYLTLPAIVESEKGFTCWTVQAQVDRLDVTVYSQMQTASMQLVY